MRNRVLFAVVLVLALLLSPALVPEPADAQCSKCRYFDFGMIGGLYACVSHTENGGPDDCHLYGDYCYTYEQCVIWLV